MATLTSDRWTIEFPLPGTALDLEPATFEMAGLDSTGAARTVATLIATAGGLLAIVSRSPGVQVQVNGIERPVIGVLNHGDEVRIGEYVFAFDALTDGSDQECIVCGDTPGEDGFRRCPICGATYCPTCEAEAAGRDCVGQDCQFRFPDPDRVRGGQR